MPHSSTLLYPSRNAGPATGAFNWPFWIMLGLLAVVWVVAWTTIYLDHPLGLAGRSRALYVDEGFYSDAAQNFVKFGRWAFPFDFQHWAGAPLLTAMQTPAFAIFGPSLETARMLSVSLGVVTALGLYSLLRMGLASLPAALLTLSGILTFGFALHGRSALADPSAVCFSILALLAFARVRSREAAIPLSIALSAAAVLTKVYFVFTLAAVVGLWLIELWIRPLMAGETGHKRHLTVLALTLLAAAALFAVFIYAFGHHLQAYYVVNSSKIPYLDPLQLASNFGESFRALPGNTKAQVFLLVLVASGGLAVALSGLPRGRRFLRSNAAGLNRADLAAGLWLVLGLLVIGLLQPPKPHYHLFAIPPLCLAAAAGLKLVIPARLDIAAICAMAIANLVYQALYYQVWMQRPGKASLHNASREVVRIIHQDSGESMIPVIGEYSAQLGLFSERVFSLDGKWSPDYALCERVVHWTPAYHVNIVWPGSVSRSELDSIAGCRQVVQTEEIARFGIRPPSRDQLVLSRIHYED